MLLADATRRSVMFSHKKVFVTLIFSLFLLFFRFEEAELRLVKLKEARYFDKYDIQDSNKFSNEGNYIFCHIILLFSCHFILIFDIST